VAVLAEAAENERVVALLSVARAELVVDSPLPVSRRREAYAALVVANSRLTMRVLATVATAELTAR
jgi:hypothetical protein